MAGAARRIHEAMEAGGSPAGSQWAFQGPAWWRLFAAAISNAFQGAGQVVFTAAILIFAMVMESMTFCGVPKAYDADGASGRGVSATASADQATASSGHPTKGHALQ
jgi:hypothetical protein